MKFSNRTLLTALFILAAVMSPPSSAQTSAEKTASTTNTAATADAKKKNIQAYINLMREDLGHDKAEIMGAVMALSAADAAKFWPIYSEYDAQQGTCLVDSFSSEHRDDGRRRGSAKEGYRRGGNADSDSHG